MKTRYPCYFGFLAQLYYPDKQRRTAVRLFRKELTLTSGLLKALTKEGYKPTTRKLTRRQVRVIERYIGEAG